MHLRKRAHPAVPRMWWVGGRRTTLYFSPRLYSMIGCRLLGGIVLYCPYPESRMVTRGFAASSVSSHVKGPPSMLRIMLLAASLCAVLTIPTAWEARNWMSADGLSYLEVASNTVQGGPWYLLSNGYWSPAYPALLAAALRIVHPSLSSELAVIHWLDIG
jgi:hypothetical protein